MKNILSVSVLIAICINSASASTRLPNDTQITQSLENVAGVSFKRNIALYTTESLMNGKVMFIGESEWFIDGKTVGKHIPSGVVGCYLTIQSQITKDYLLPTSSQDGKITSVGTHFSNYVDVDDGTKSLSQIEIIWSYKKKPSVIVCVLSNAGNHTWTIRDITNALGGNVEIGSL